MAKIIWKDVLGYEKYYQVSNSGLIRSKDRIVKRQHGDYLHSGRILKHGLNSKGYCIVVLSVNAIKSTQKVHRLVALAFIPNPSDYPQVHHKDDNPLNNRVSNLKWGNNQMNMQQCSANGRLKIPHYHGTKNHKSKFTTRQIISIRKSKKNFTKLATQYKVGITTISRIVNRRSYTNI